MLICDTLINHYLLTYLLTRMFVRSLVRFFIRNSGTFVEFLDHSYLHHRYSIRFALVLMTLHSRFHAQGGARGQDIGHLILFLLIILKNDILFSI